MLHSIEKSDKIKFPLIVTVEPTNLCNLSCLYCSRQLMDRPIGSMDKKVFQKNVDECAKHKSAIRQSDFGEPLLHLEMIGFLEMTQKAGVLTTTFTNGTGFTEKMMNGVVDKELDEIRFSSSGISEKEHNKVRKGSDFKKDFESKVERLAQIRKDKSQTKPYIVVYSNVLSYEEESFKESVENYQDHFLQWSDKVDIDLTMFSRVKGLDHVKDFYDKKRIQKVHKLCVYLFLKVVIHWNSDVFACDKLVNQDETCLLGNLSEEGSSIEEMVNDPKIQGLRDKLSFSMQQKGFSVCKDCFSNTNKWNTEEV